MGTYDANDAELNFFSDLLGEGDQSKEAADLAPDTAEVLGVQTVSPSILDKLEAQAGGGQPQEEAPAESAPAEPEPEAAPEAEPAPPPEVESEPPQPEEAVDVGAAPVRDEEPVQAEAVEPELPSRVTHGRLFTERRAHPLQIFDVLTMRYKEEWPEWEPDTLWWALRRDFGPIGEIARNKIQALGLAAITDVPWLDWDVFENCGLAWNDFIPIFGAFQPMTPMQVAFTIQVLRGVRADEEISNEVNAYAAAVLDEHGWAYAPEEWFGNAQELLDRKVWMLGFKADVASSWEQIKDVPPEEIEWEQNDPRGIHLLKLAVVKRYLEGREGLRQQVPGVPASSVTASPPVP